MSAIETHAARSDARRLGLWAVALLVLAAALGTRLWMETLRIDNRIGSVDLTQFFYPSSRFVGEEYAAGRLPLWNPHLGLGTSEVADIQIELFYPATLLFVVLPAHWVIEISMLLHIALAAFGVFLLCRASGLCCASALVGAVALATGEALHFLAGWPAILATFAWCPLAFFAARRLSDEPGPRAALFLSAVLGLQILAGYVQLHLYTVVCLPLFAVPAAGLLSRSMVSVLLWLAAAEIGAAALGAIALAPAMAAVGDSLRSREMLQPWFYELIPVRLGDYYGGLAAHRLKGIAPIFYGAAVPLLAVAGVLARGVAPRLRPPVLILGVVAVVLSLGRSTPVFELLWKLPISHWLTGPYKWTFFSALVLVLLAGVGAETLLAPGPRARVGAVGRVVWGLVGGVFLLVFPFSLGQRLLGVAVLAAALLLAARPSPSSRRLLACALIASVAAGSVLGLQARASRPKDRLPFFAGFSPAFQFARALQENEQAGRLFGLTPVLAYSLRQAEFERVAQVNTMETLQPARTFEVVRAIEQKAAGDAAERARAVALLRSIGAGLVLTLPDEEPWLADEGLTRDFTSSAADVWRDRAALPRAYLAGTVEEVPRERVVERLAASRPEQRLAVLEPEPGHAPVGERTSVGQVEIVSSTSDEVRLSVAAAGPALLVLLDSWNPGWRASVDGEPAAIRRANLVARAVELPAGAREVIFRFAPRPFYLGALVSAVALAAWLVVAAVLWSRRSGARASR